MKKLLYLSIIWLVGIFWFLWFTHANVDTMNVAPTTQTAISGSTVTFTITGHNGTGIAYLKYVLPKTATYDLMYQNSTFTTTTLINNALLSMWAEHDPLYSIPSDSDFSVTITAKLVTTNRSFSPITPQAIFCADTNFTTLLGAVNTTIKPIADLKITNILTGTSPSYSGDTVSYYVTLQNIWSTSATGINFVSNFPIPTLSTPTASFNGTPYIYSNISYPNDFIWSGAYLSNLHAWESIIILINALLTNDFAPGTAFSSTAKTTTVSPEFTTGNNSALATGAVQTLTDVRITQTLTPFTGYRQWDEVTYTIAYGNSGGKTADNVHITSSMDGQVTLNASSFPIGSLPGGSGGTIVLTGSLATTLSSGFTFTHTVDITTTHIESNTGNNSAVTTGTIQWNHGLYVNITANNLTRPQLNNPPYGSGTDLMIQAVSWDVIQFNVTYGNSGSTMITHATLYVSGQQNNFTTTNPYNATINIVDIDEINTLTVTWIVWPKNFISFSLFPYIRHDIWEREVGNTITIVEPMVCGDGLLTRNEVCDTQGNIGVLYSGQTCENQQWQCVLVTNAITNLACINYSFVNPLGGPARQEQSCSSVNTAITSASCASLTGSTPTATSNGYSIAYTCRGNSTNDATPITINCGNGNAITWTWSELNGTCSYDSSFAGTAQCRVGSDVNNSACRLAVNETQLQCDLEALDGRIILVDDNGEWEGRFRCETRDAEIAQTISIDCGDGGTSDQWGRYATASNTSQLETLCSYDENTTPENKIVTCSTNDVICETENIIVDEPILGYCGNGIIEWYEDCDDRNNNNDDGCTNGCDIRNADMVSCFNVNNMNISIQKGEQLPFRWMLDGSKNIISGSSCVGESDGKIPVESMYCTFSVYNGNNLESRNDPIYSVTKKCKENSWEENNVKLPLFAYFLEPQNPIRSLKNAFGKYSIDSDKFIDTNNEDEYTFGEYKLVLEKVEYDYCRDNNEVDSTAIDRVCSVNFAVTQPYIAQKSLFSRTPKSTDIRLDKYKTIDGEDLIDSTDLNEIMVLNESNYNGGTKVRSMIRNFITKYDNLALTVPKSSLKNTAFKDTDVTVKIVPSQKIYILQSDTRKTVLLENIQTFTAPFTIVTQNIDLIIKGNVDYNGMFLVQNGTIEFQQADDIKQGDRCPSPQTVKGIFITDEGFVATSQSLRNDDLTKKRCNYGNLHVKGILMGDGINDLVNSRRSQLNTWFYTKSSAEIAIKSERRNKIFDGAAVLIEYSPSLWSALPPGASEFTEVLNVYKQ